MYQYEDVRIRKFTFEDIPMKIEYINNSANNEFLHYDLPLEYNKTVAWFEKNKDRTDRFDAVIEYCGEPVGLTGLLNIDYKNSKAEDYMIVGNTSYKRKGIATKAGTLMALYCFETLKLNRLYAFIEVGNPSLGLDLKRGFHVEGYLRQSIRKGNIFVDRYVLGMSRRDLVIPGEVCWEED
ncbi:GNAT family protein [Hungatella sp.]|uniref:GNAT family N-acetyltransferase n=1 Tax=Hungatella sp. TaxID=2613924 RepID=UPI002A81FFE0|nr:GNAT family protein [Hungatella sp.]